MSRQACMIALGAVMAGGLVAGTAEAQTQYTAPQSNSYSYETTYQAAPSYAGSGQTSGYNTYAQPAPPPAPAAPVYEYTYAEQPEQPSGAYMGDTQQLGGYGQAQPYGQTQTYGQAQPYGQTQTYGQAQPYGQTQTYGQAQPYGQPQQQAYGGYNQQTYGGQLEQPTYGGYSYNQPSQPAQPTYGAPQTSYAAPTPTHYIQVAAFRRTNYAERLLQTLVAAGENAFIIQANVNGVNYNRVRIPATGEADARAVLGRVRSMGYADARVVRN